MIPNLLAATQRYWHQLDELDAAYQRGEVSIQEVDTRVAELMVELGQERRATWQFLSQSWRGFWIQQRETVIGLGLLGGLSYAWAILR